MKKIYSLALVFCFCLINPTGILGQGSCDNTGFHFKTGKLVETLDFAKLLVVADFNKDGNLDFANYQSSSPIQNLRAAIEIQLGNGHGDFGVSKVISLGYSPFSFDGNQFKSGDFNGDGNVDLCNVGFGQLKVWYGNGQGDFSPVKEYPLNSQSPLPIPSSRIIVTDVNSDGRSDVMFINGSLQVLLATSEGGFSTPKELALSGSLTLLEAYDLNGDGKPELIASGSGSNTLYIFSNEGDGKFLAPVQITTAMFPSSIAIGDFTGDQRSEIIVSTSAGTTTDILINNGTGGFSTTKTILNRGINGITTGDFNKDGKLDFAFTQNQSYANYQGNLGICFGDGTGNFSTASTYMMGVTPQGLSVGDFNKDGFLDLLSPDTILDGVNLVFGEVNGNFAAGRITTIENVNSFGGKISVGDINKDSIPDVIAVGQTVYAFEGRGNGSFKVPAIYDSKYKLGSLSTASLISDLNKDGQPDLVITGNYTPTGNFSTNGSVTILWGSTATGYTEANARFYTVGQTPSSVIAADVNGDSWVDLIVTNAGSNSVSILLNDTRGQFLPAVNFPTGLEPQSISAADFNGDNLNDLIVGNRNSAGISLLINDGAGGFTTSLIGIAANPGRVQALDINGDRKQDIIIGQQNAGNITVLLGNGNGTFAPRINSIVGGRVIDFVTNDVNRDGKIDLILTLNVESPYATSDAQNRFLIYVGDGTGKFYFGAETIASRATYLAVNDLTGDGTPDLAISSPIGIQVFPGICNTPTDSNSLVTVNAANYNGIDLAPNQIVAGFGSGLSTTTLAATSVPLPSELGGTIVKVKDSKGDERVAPLFFVSPSQVNFQIPSATAIGFGTIKITNNAGKTVNGGVLITAVKPGLFTATNDGTGTIAGSALRILYGTGQQIYEPVSRYDEILKRIVPVPVLLPSQSSSADTLYLILYGTGIRGNTSLDQVRVIIGGRSYAVDYAGQHCCFAGVDQINVRIVDPYNVSRSELDIRIEVDGKISNVGKITFE